MTQATQERSASSLQDMPLFAVQQLVLVHRSHPCSRRRGADWRREECCSYSDP